MSAQARLGDDAKVLSDAQGCPAHRLGDETTHCGGTGQRIAGSGDAFTGG